MPQIFVDTDNSDPKNKLFVGTKAGGAKAEEKMQKVVIKVIGKADGFTTDKTVSNKGYAIRLTVSNVVVGDHDALAREQILRARDRFLQRLVRVVECARLGQRDDALVRRRIREAIRVELFALLEEEALQLHEIDLERRSETEQREQVRLHRLRARGFRS